MRLVFAGTPAVAVPALRTLAERHDVAAVVTRPDAPLGRKRVLTPSPVAEAATELGIEVIKAARLGEEATERIAAVGAELGVIVAYGGLVREPLLSMPRLGWINLHFSLLPRWRGAAPVQRAIIAGDETTGASVFQLVPELDQGDVYGQLTQPIGAHETAGHLLDSLALSGAELLVQVIDAIADGEARSEPQVGEVTLAPKLNHDDGRIDWTLPAPAVDSLIRGVTPEPGAFTMLDDQRLKVLDATIARDRPRLAPGAFAPDAGSLVVGTATDPIELIMVHPAGKKPMRAPDWWRGRPTDAVAVAS